MICGVERWTRIAIDVKTLRRSFDRVHGNHVSLG